jgi:CRP/FNR family transcriptional regulator, cyclic AMP receptor protein
MVPAAIRDSLAKHPFLEGIPDPLLDRLLGLAFEVTFEPDQILFREADPSSFFYLILSGNIAIEIAMPGRVLRIQTAGEGEELGWSSIMTKVNKQFQARSLSPVRAIAFDGVRLKAECDADPAFGYFIMCRVLEIVADRLRATRFQMLDVYSSKGVVS